jgi:hypothetical protein
MKNKEVKEIKKRLLTPNILPDIYIEIVKQELTPDQLELTDKVIQPLYKRHIINFT